MNPARRLSEAALTCLEEAFILCIPEPGDQIEVVEAAKRMGLEDGLQPFYGQKLAHAIAERLVEAGHIRQHQGSNGRWIAQRLPSNDTA